MVKVQPGVGVGREGPLDKVTNADARGSRSDDWGRHPSQKVEHGDGRRAVQTSTRGEVTKADLKDAATEALAAESEAAVSSRVASGQEEESYNIWG